jgi:REP element-mobilizing transposase RayT
MMNEPLAYFLTWTTYGSWLPGDERFWTSRNHGHQPPDDRIKRFSKSLMKEESVLLSDREREIVEQAIKDHCELKKWNILAINVRTNHVHVVLECDIDPKTAMQQFKMWATRRLNDESKHQRKKCWSRGGSVKILHTDESVENTVRYTVEGQ